jgi:thiol:disulfide interchange protein DsbD
MNVEAFEPEVTFAREVVPPRYEAGRDPVARPLPACTDRECLPKRLTLTAKVNFTGAQAASIPAGYSEFTGQRSPALGGGGAPVKAIGGDRPPQDLWSFLLLAFGLRPCRNLHSLRVPDDSDHALVLPEQAGSAAAGYPVLPGIVVMFTGMGLLVTAALGPFGVVQLGSSPWVNGFIAAVFIIFGLSLLGAFEITLPSGLLTKMDQASQRGGSFGTLLMGLTFSLTSFACVGPFIGTLLASSVQRGGIQPALGR